MNRQLRLRSFIYGKAIYAYIAKLDEGLNVLIVGGIKTHVGAVSHAFPGVEPETLKIPGHKDFIVSERWAKQLADQFNTPVCVECGIHYDQVSKEQLSEIVTACDALLLKAMLVIEQEHF